MHLNLNVNLKTPNVYNMFKTIVIHYFVVILHSVSHWDHSLYPICVWLLTVHLAVPLD